MPTLVPVESLTDATVPLAGDELVPIVQNGNSRKVTATELADAATGAVQFVSDVASGTILGRVAAGTGNSEELTPAQARTLLGVSDVVEVLEDVAPDTLIGRVSAGAGDSEELTPAQVRALINVEDNAQENRALATPAQIHSRASGVVITPEEADLANGFVTLVESGGNIPVDLAAGINFELDLDGNHQFSNPSNVPSAGSSGVIVVTQDGTGSRVPTWASNYKFNDGVAPTLSTTPNAVDVLAYLVLSSTSIWVTQPGTNVS